MLSISQAYTDALCGCQGCCAGSRAEQAVKQMRQSSYGGLSEVTGVPRTAGHSLSPQKFQKAAAVQPFVAAAHAEEFRCVSLLQTTLFMHCLLSCKGCSLQLAQRPTC